MPRGPRGPYSASRVSPATIVGSANGRSMIALTSALPRKSSRTRTHAVIVPSTALIKATMKAAPNVSFSAATVSGLDTICQKPCAPLFFDSQSSAASGRTTTTIRNVEMTPRDRPVLTRPSARPLRAAVGADAAMLLMAGASDCALDADHPARVRIEPDTVRLAPPAEEAVPGVENRPRGVLLCPPLEGRSLPDCPHDRPGT